MTLTNTMKRLQISIHIDVYNWIKKLAKRKGISLSAIIRNILYEIYEEEIDG